MMLAMLHDLDSAFLLKLASLYALGLIILMILNGPFLLHISLLGLHCLSLNLFFGVLCPLQGKPCFGFGVKQVDHLLAIDCHIHEIFVPFLFKLFYGEIYVFILVCKIGIKSFGIKNLKFYWDDCF